MTNAPLEVPLNVSHRVPVDTLRLDRLNPRLVGIDSKITDEAIIAQLYRSEDLSELLQSIAANGYLDIEPLIVIQDGPSRLTVLEGNRRLAAIRLFREPELVVRIDAQLRLRVNVPDISAELRSTLDAVLVYRVENRDAARSYIGFKHINGAAKWDSYAKAKFAAEWYRNGATSLEQISEKIGDKHDTIKRMVTAIYVLDQAENAGVFSVADRTAGRFNFSHLYTALSRTPYMQFLGLDTAWSRYDPTQNPIAAEKLKNLREVLVWIYGSKEDSKSALVLSQNPGIKQLGEALSNPEGLVVLRGGGSLEEAHASTQPADEKLSSSLLRARATLREASNNLRGYDGQDKSLLNIAEDISESAVTIYTRMRDKFKDAAGS